MEFPTEEQFEQIKVLHHKALKWREVPTDIIYQIESVEERSTMIGNAMVVNLVGKYGSRFSPIRTFGGGGVFHQDRGFLPITLEIIKVHSQNLVTFPKI